ncbi:MAG: nucleoside deaminase [Gammaproteobacteria bacterium]|nr:nucleoside deaminase [Gammaproteobacteria bacterium]
MLAAIAQAELALPRAEGGPFGACIVRGASIIACANNTVLHEHDATCHAEVNAIHIASRALGNFDLSGCIIYSTTEPCPMCFSAIHWARIDRIVYGTCIADVQQLGFNELAISNQQLRALGGSPVLITADFMRPECEALLARWQALPGARLY